MDETIVTCKAFEYTGRATIALKLGDQTKARNASRMTLVLYRLQAREAIEKLRSASGLLRAAERSIKKAEHIGILFPLGEQRVERLSKELRAAKEELSEVGRGMGAVLDLWQRLGATLQDLCSLCNRDYEQVVAEVQKDRLNESFSGLIFVYNLDYKDPSNRGWIDYDVDAPFTHAIKEHYLDLMLNTPEGKKASHAAFESVFPDIAENALTLVTDTDGVKHFIDKDGVEVGTVEEE